ncbi:alkyl sulfatase dimerization domain-containing protein [Tsukamurella sp. 8F]|uniref:alkyl/aryl-sulfatase n=1 Tax=unclassified Tsukamurella TaxID=2633480 RepID=UPI0023B918B7|nr:MULTISPECIES: alkyl sulfatase dimerization domain-containing protein [unclassified Tsukamurella]MDF0530397.1 alkyl sulfatase dimerization domain-containing protein [Tsukamurella sp. 8J]MDF0587782.1 alkyl sulfatase dimerization domain-containing protein [Tsukamurella sp. 8F]
MTGSTEPSEHVVAAAEAAKASLPFDDTRDADDARRGFVAALEPGTVVDGNGNTVWDNDSYAFLRDACPSSVHPSLWRQCGLVIEQGLYEVTDGIYQVRGLDLSNMTIVEGDAGIVVIDPLISTETAAAALALYRTHRGDRPVTGLIYTHSHVDHFGGALGVTTRDDVESGRCPVLAPTGFLEHAVAENVYAGTAMARRSGYMYGAALPRGPKGQVGAGLGQTTSVGTVSLLPPTLHITHTGQEETLDGVRIVFQITPGTEAPAEMNFYFPDRRALCVAENATHTLHNLLTLRGALVRDPHVWSTYLTEAINLFGRRSEVAFASHHWPTWGTDRLVEYLSVQRDLYAYLHDQTLRRLNQGYTGIEIAETIQLPPAIESAWHARGYYGSVNHNVKAIYQRYMGWFDGNPAHLWQHPPIESARRHVEFMGGADEVLRKARTAYDAGDYRWVAQVVDYVVYADPTNADAKALQANTFEQLGYGAENATWRNFYLTGAHELRHGNGGTPTQGNSTAFVSALTVEQTFDALALNIDGPRSWHSHIVIDWHFTDADRTYRTELRNGVLIHHDRFDDDGLPSPDTTVTGTRPALFGALRPGPDLAAATESGEIRIDGDEATLPHLLSMLDRPDRAFDIVTPRQPLPET